MTSATHDLIVVGLGSAGMTATTFAARLGLRVVGVERYRVGGDCLWTGCVPSKTLLASAAAAHAARSAGAFGVRVGPVVVDTAAVWQRIRRVQADIAQAEDSAEALAATGVDVVIGTARLAGAGRVEVAGPEGRVNLTSRFVLLCTGSHPSVPDITGLTDAGFLTSETLWELDEAPASVIIIGGGPIGVELGQAFVRLGVATTLLQRRPSILPRDEALLSGRLAEVLRSEGVEVHVGVEVADVRRLSGARSGVEVRGRVGGVERTWQADAVVVAAGRRPSIEDLGLEDLGIAVDGAGVLVDDRQRTSIPSIYAVGDLTGRARFTHAAAYQGVRAVRDMFFPGRGRADASIPWVTYTDPELAHTGMTETQARRAHGAAKVRSHIHELTANDRARATGATGGALHLVTVKDRLVGASLLAPNAGELIAELALAIDQRLDLRDLAALVHPYPTIATGVALLAADDAFRAARRYRWLTRLPRRWR